MSDRIKKQIIDDILAFKTEINTAGYGVPGLFETVLKENPELLAYVAGYSVSSPLFSRGVIFKVQYHNTDVPKKALFTVKTDAEVEDVFHRAIGSYYPAAIILAPHSVNVPAAYSSFNVAFDGFYSNLMENRLSGWDMSSSPYRFYRLDFKYRIGRVKLIMMERDVDKEVDRLSRVLFAPGMLPETKAYIAHNYLARNVEYWLKEDANKLEMSYRQSAYGALINKKCVCQGYAEAYKRLLDTQGIVNYVLCGKVKGSTVHHAWNAVSFNGRDFFHVDVTWDSRGGGLSSHTYFCKTDEEMKPTRIWTRRPGVYCNSKENIHSIATADIFRNKAKYIAAGVDKANF